MFISPLATETFIYHERRVYVIEVIIWEKERSHGQQQAGIEQRKKLKESQTGSERVVIMRGQQNAPEADMT